MTRSGKIETLSAARVGPERVLRTRVTGRGGKAGLCARRSFFRLRASFHFGVPAI